MGNKKIIFEWDIETLDEHGDIYDHNFSDKFPGIPEDACCRVVLVRDVFEYPDNDTQRKCEPELVDRSYAYIQKGKGKLPEYFENGVRVPRKFHNELSKAIAKPALNINLRVIKGH